MLYNIQCLYDKFILSYKQDQKVPAVTCIHDQATCDAYGPTSNSAYSGVVLVQVVDTS